MFETLYFFNFSIYLYAVCNNKYLLADKSLWFWVTNVTVMSVFVLRIADKNDALGIRPETNDQC